MGTKMTLTQSFKCVLTACICYFALAGQAIADQLLDAEIAYKTGDYEKAAQLLKPLADQVFDETQYNIDVNNVRNQIQLNMEESNKLTLRVLSYLEEAYKAEQDDSWASKLKRQLNGNTAEYYSKQASIENDALKIIKEHMELLVKQSEKLSVLQGLISKSALAQRKLGVMYSFGQGVSQDDKEAARWFKLAANKGLTDAQRDLGTMYYLGRGVSKNLVLAQMCFNVAAANKYDSILGDAQAKLHDEISKQLTENQISEAQELTTKCIEKNMKGCF